MKWLTEEADLALIRHGDADHHADGGGLAGAVGAEQAVDTALANAQREMIDGDKMVVGLADAPQFYRKCSFGFQVSSFKPSFEFQVYARPRWLLEIVSRKIGVEWRC